MYREQIDAYLDGKLDEMIRDLEVLVRIDSQKGEAKEGMPYGEGPAKVLKAASDLMEKYGLAVKNYGNRVVTGDLSDCPKELDILAHLDVVPVTPDWTMTAPFEPKIIDGKMYGRGTSDDKGPAIAALYAIRAMKDLNIPLSKSVRLILGSDEECGSSDLDYYYAQEEEAPCSFTPDADFPLINVEKGHFSKNFHASFEDNGKLPRVLSLKGGTKLNVVPQHAWIVLEGLDRPVLEEAAGKVAEKAGVTMEINEAAEGKDLADGSKVYEIHVRGISAHASTPEEGKNAILAALELISELPLADSQGLQALKGLKKLFPFDDTQGRALGIACEEPQSGKLTMCFSLMDYTPSSMNGGFDSRVPVGFGREEIAVPVGRQLEEYGIYPDNLDMVEPHCVPADSDFVRTLLSSYETYFGRKGEPISTGGGTYVHRLKRGVAFGCMTEDEDVHMHGDDEFMRIERLLTSAKIFADAIVKLCM